MTITLAHPPAEDLGRFIEGTLDDASRVAVVDHIADCDDCRIVVVDASEFSETATAKRGSGGRWMAIAASLIVVVGAGVFVWNESRKPLAPVIETSAHSSFRYVAARLTGFPYKPQKSTTRGSGDSELDTDAFQVEEKAITVLHISGHDPKMQNARGVAGLLVVQARLANHDYDDNSDQAAKDRDGAINQLRSAANASNKATYLSDLAAAFIAKGDPASLELAVETCKKAQLIDRNSPEALFNRAIALELIGRTSDAITAYDAFLKVDHSSPWATEARDRVVRLKELALP